MPRPVTLFTGQWADMPLNELAEKAGNWGYDGLELACWGDHFDVEQAASNDAYCRGRRDILEKYSLGVWAISAHLVGQAVCDRIDERHQAILPERVWGDGDPEGVRRRAAEEMKVTAAAAHALGVEVVCGFTGSPIWHLMYPFPPTPERMIQAGYQEFADRWIPILDVFREQNVHFALEVHPTEIAFDSTSAVETLDSLIWHESFGFNFDPSHLAYQGVDYVSFLYDLGEHIRHVHMKDVRVSATPTSVGVFGGHTNFGHPDRYWDFCSLGRGSVDFEAIIRALNRIEYEGPLSVEWEDPGMDREHGAREACAFVKRIDFPPSVAAFDAAFAGEDKGQE